MATMHPDLSSAALPNEQAVYPYAASAGLPGRTLLVFAPHPDDEVFGCGGTLARAVDAGCSVVVVIVSDGGAGGDASVRESEVHAAAAQWAHPQRMPAIHFWRLADRGLCADEAIVARMAALIESSGADCVLAPSPLEVHPDHRVISVAATDAFARLAGCSATPCLAYYEVGHPLLPNVLVDITPVLARKSRAMALFVSQLAAQRYDAHVLALNRYRSYTLGAAVTHAEAFHVIDAAAAARGIGALIDGWQRGLLWRLGRTAWP